MRFILMIVMLIVLFGTGPVATLAAEQQVGQADQLKTVTLDIQNMDCSLCRITIRKALENVDGVTGAKVNLDAKTATVTFDPEIAGIKVLTDATTNAGYPSTVRE